MAVVTGIDPFEHRHEVKGDEGLQIARKLWVHLLSAEFNISKIDAARMLARNRETIIINLSEMEDWRDAELHPRGAVMLDRALDEMGEALRGLMDTGQIATGAMPTPIERSRIARMRQVRA